MEYDNPTTAEWLKRRKRLALYLGSYVAIVAVQTAIYWWGMATFEADPRSVGDALGVVVQSHTTTGYGQDAPWGSAVMSLYSILLQYTGIAYIFIAFPLFVVPWLESVVTETTVPESIDEVDGHVVLCGYSSLCSTLVEDLEARGEPYVIVDEDGDRTAALYESDHTVVHGDVTSEETLRNVHVADAQAIVIDSREIEGINTVLTIREIDDDVDVVCLVEDPEHSQYLRYAGATTVLSPRHRLGNSLADKAQSAGSADLGIEEYDVDVKVAEFPITRESQIHGRSLADLDEVQEAGADTLGAWIRGDFVTTFSSSDYLDENSVLIVAGTAEQLDHVAEVTHSYRRFPKKEPVVVAGHGLTGTTAEGILRKADLETTVVDREPGEGVDVVGDATDAGTLHDAGVPDAATVMLTLSDDDDTILATLVADEIGTDAEIIVAAEDPDNTSKLYRAGADFVLALPNLAGRMTSLELFEEDVVTLHGQIRLEELDGQSVDDDLPTNDELREATDSVVVAVRHDGDTVTGADEIDVAGADQVVVAGTDDGVDAFKEEFVG